MCHPEPPVRLAPLAQGRLRRRGIPRALAEGFPRCARNDTSHFAQSVILNNPGRKPAFAIRHATIYPVTSAPIADGTIVFSNGLITAIGTNVAIPPQATVIDGA